MRPNAADVRVALGDPKLGRLIRLKASQRNCTRCDSVIRNVFDIDTSQPKVPGPSTMLRPALPNVPAALALNTDVLKNFASISARGRSLGSAGDPLTFGRSKFTPVSELSRPLRMFTGCPASTVTTPPNSHPPNPRAYHRFPRNTGNSYK